MILYQFRCAIKCRPSFLVLSLYFYIIVCNMDLVELTNRYTPPSNTMEYLTEQGYFVIIRNENGQLSPYNRGKPQNMGDVLIVINNDNLLIPNRMFDLSEPSDTIRCQEIMETETIDLTNTPDTPEELPDISSVSDILRCGEVMDGTPQVSKMIPPVVQPANIKFIIKDPTPQLEWYWKECYDYMKMKNEVMAHIKNKSPEQIVVCGTLEDLKVLNTEILYHKGLSETKFIF